MSLTSCPLSSSTFLLPHLPVLFFFFFLLLRLPPISTLFPYTTLFRSLDLTGSRTWNVPAPSDVPHVETEPGVYTSSAARTADEDEPEAVAGDDASVTAARDDAPAATTTDEAATTAVRDEEPATVASGEEPARATRDEEP